ncbi:hypothetical protein L0F63_006647, partial [Massospora cicadina]
EIILGMVEFSVGTPKGGLHVNWEILETRALDGKDRELVMHWLAAIGIPEGTWRHPEDFPLYIEAKRQRRAAWHEQAAKRLQQELERLISCHLETSAKKTGNGPYSAPSMLMQLNKFLIQFHSHMGAAPLIHGLRAVLRAQMQDLTRSLVWVLDDASLTQSGIEFMMASVASLITTLGFKPGKPNALSQREWLVQPHFTQFQLYALVRLIDGYKLSFTGIAGSYHVSNPPIERPYFRRSWLWSINASFSFLTKPLSKLLVFGIYLSAL